MTFAEFWAEYEYNAPSDHAGTYAGGLRQGQVDELREWMESGYK